MSSEVSIPLSVKGCWEKYSRLTKSACPDGDFHSLSKETLEDFMETTFMAGASSVIAILSRAKNLGATDGEGALLVKRVCEEIKASEATMMERMLRRIIDKLEKGDQS